MSSAVEHTIRTIFRRCLNCPPETPTCPACGGGEICSLVPSSCNECAKMVCIRDSAGGHSRGPNVGAIAGGVIGGVAFMALVVFLLWRFWIRKRRAEQEAEAEEWEGDDIAHAKALQFNAMHQDAASTRTRGSLANSIFSRASNFIQIAYIPGVTTNRSGGGSSHNSLGPVPPIPAARRDIPRSPLANDDGALFFMPGDLRDSTYSGTSSIGGKRDTQYTRASITPSLARSSVASGLYHDDEPPPPMPAQQVFRAAPRMVSVKSASVQSIDSASSTSPKSHSDLTDFTNSPSSKDKNVQVMMPGQGESSAGGSVKSVGKAHQITLGSKGKVTGRVPVRQPSDSSILTAGTSKTKPVISSPLAGLGDDSENESEDENVRARQSLVRSGSNSGIATPITQPLESPFFDASENPSLSALSRPNPYASMAKSVGTSIENRPNRGARGINALSDIMEEAARRASQATARESLANVQESSPFSDVHEAK